MAPFAEDEMNRMLSRMQGTFWELLGCRLTDIGPHRAVIELEAEAKHLNHLGIVHGGVYASLLDQAMGAAAMTVKPNETIVTTNLNVHYTTASKGGRLEAAAQIVHATKRLITAEARIVDQFGSLCAWGSGTFQVTGPKGGGGGG